MANGHHMEQRISRPSKKAYEINRIISLSLMRNFNFPRLVLGIEEEFQRSETQMDTNLMELVIMMRLSVKRDA